MRTALCVGFVHHAETHNQDQKFQQFLTFHSKLSLQELGGKSLNLCQCRKVKEDTKVLVRIRPAMQALTAWMEMFLFLDGIQQPTFDPAPLGTSARAIQKQVNARRQKNKKSQTGGKKMKMGM